MRRVRIGKATWSDPAIGSAFRKTQEALDSIADQQIFVTEPQQYSAPMLLATGDERVPRIVHLARVVNSASPTTPVAYGAVTWQYAGGPSGQIKILDIAGMSASATRYMFTWKVEW